VQVTQDFRQVRAARRVILYCQIRGHGTVYITKFKQALEIKFVLSLIYLIYLLFVPYEQEIKLVGTEGIYSSCIWLRFLI
jgi:hypothetical protein